MKYLIVLLTLLSLNCTKSVEQKGDIISENHHSDSAESSLQLGFLLVKIMRFYQNGGELVIYDKENRDTIIYLHDSKIFIEGAEYDIIDEEHLYREHIEVESYFPEYNLFIMSCAGKVDEFYEVLINGVKGLIPINSSNVIFKSFEQYILDTYPVPTESNPLRKAPSENSEVIPNYSEHTYLALEIDGDWVKVRDDKDCYSGEAPSETDIEGWIRWREDGVFILKVAHVC